MSSETPTPDASSGQALYRRAFARGIRFVLVGCFFWGLLAGVSLLDFKCDVDPTSSLGKLELPLGSPNGLAVDRERNIYVGSLTYQRIQVYGPDGRFQRSYYMGANTGGGDFFFRVNGRDELEVYGYRGKLFCVFTSAGLQSKVALPGLPSFSRNFDGVVGSDGAKYALNDYAWAVPRVVRTTPSGVRAVVVTQPWYLFLMKMPFPCWALGIGSLIGLLLMRLTRA
jgi:hypothetical protein